MNGDNDDASERAISSNDEDSFMEVNDNEGEK